MTKVTELDVLREAYRLRGCMEVDVMFVEPRALNQQLTVLNYVLGGGTFVVPSRLPLDDERKNSKWLIDEQGVMEVPVYGMIFGRPTGVEHFLLGESTDSFSLSEAFAEAGKLPEVKGVLLNVDSPGGVMTGGIELAHAVRELAQTKPVVAWTGGECCSLAYMMASGATELVASKTANVGSLGAYLVARDTSEQHAKDGVKVHVLVNKDSPYKAIGVHGRPYSKEDLEYLQNRVEAAYSMMREMLGRNRPQIREAAYDGRVFMAPEAQGLGLVDRIGDKAFAKSVLRAGIRAQGQGQFIER